MKRPDCTKESKPIGGEPSFFGKGMGDYWPSGGGNYYPDGWFKPEL